ncbi:high-affinity branched-chain amino acid ABC transporter permease LivM, partial [Pseudomonas sp. GW460-13]
MTNKISAMPAGQAARAAVPGQSLKNAIFAAVMTAILTIPILGLQLKLEGYKVVLE